MKRKRELFELREVWRSKIIFLGYEAVVMSDQYGRFVGLARHAETHEEYCSGIAKRSFESAYEDAISFRYAAVEQIRKTVRRLTT